MHPFGIVVEKHLDGYVAYPVDRKGIVIGEGDTSEEAVAEVTSAIQFHNETFDKGSGDYTKERKQWLEKDPEKYHTAVIAHGKKKTRS
ncbi:MAG: type II toxin-antitoxin system HicB family antitoxin [Methanoregula sp.]|jgi:predicted RNase H-like HicB family nuclease|nr:type II toxin-antitoxin system HicB family antitoxin [Methanoregula sp.]